MRVFGIIICFCTGSVCPCVCELVMIIVDRVEEKNPSYIFGTAPYTIKVSHRDSWIYFGLILGELSIYPKMKGVEFGTCRGLISEGGCLKVGGGFTEMGPNLTSRSPIYL